jgi:hypothetical protein
LPVYFAARLPGINTLPMFPSEMYEMIETGKLPIIHIGRVVRISSNALGNRFEEHKLQED